MLKSGPGPLNTQKLAETIEGLAHEVARVAAPEMATPPAPLSLQEKTPAKEASPVAKLLKLQQDIKIQFTRVAHIHGAMSEVPEGTKLYFYAQQILSEDAKLQHLHDQVLHYQETGKFFDELPENQPKPYNLEQEIKNTMASRSKLRKKLDKTVLPNDRKKLEKKIAEFERQLENLRAQRHA